jgi:hypothetical protein
MPSGARNRLLREGSRPFFTALRAVRFRERPMHANIPRPEAGETVGATGASAPAGECRLTRFFGIGIFY